MAEDDDKEKTEEPSEQKKREYREKGKVAKSQEINGTVGLLVGFGIIIVYSGTIATELGQLSRVCWSWTSDVSAETHTITHFFTLAGDSLLSILAVPMAAMWAGAAVVGLVQSRGVIPEDGLKPDLNRINPVTSFKQKFLSAMPFVEGGKGLMKMGLIGASVWWGLSGKIRLLPALINAEPIETALTMRELALMVLIRALPVAILISVIDYTYQFYKLKKQMMMSKQDLKDEHKRAEGDPHYKAHRRRRQVEIARAVRAVDAVPRADVIITNPTHYAIALRYRPAESPAPVVLARGVDHLALKMRTVARQHDIPRIENRPLARALYAQSKEGQMIPEDLYAAVAEVLAVIYRRRGRRR